MTAEIPANGETIVLTFDEALGGSVASVALQKLFTVSGGREVTGLAISGEVVTLTLAKTFREGQRVTVSYDDEGGCRVDSTVAIQNGAGEDALGFSEFPVTNNSTAENKPLGPPTSARAADSDRIRLDFSGPPSSSRAPTSAWTILVNGNDRTDRAASPDDFHKDSVSDICGSRFREVSPMETS